MGSTSVYNLSKYSTRYSNIRVVCILSCKGRITYSHLGRMRIQQDLPLIKSYIIQKAYALVVYYNVMAVTMNNSISDLLYSI